MPATPSRRVGWIAGAIAVVALVVVASLPRDEPAAPSRAWWLPSGAAAAPTAAPTPPVVATPVFVPVPVFGATPPPATSAPSSSALGEVDAALARGDRAAAMTELDALIALSPRDGALQGRRARLLAATEGEDADALAAFAGALALDPTLLDDRDVAADLFALVRRPKLREDAVGFAIDSLGDRGLPLLVEFVHAPTPVLGYAARHRALDRIRQDPEHAAMLDAGLQRSLDLWQASQTPAPCVTFAAGLDAIALEPTPDVLGTLHRVSPPVAPAAADAATVATCALLPARLQAVRAQVLAAHPVPAAQWTVPPAYATAKKKPKKRGVLRRLFGG